jgi:4-hydroxy-3-methylbut-2-enyl diphosphate reductase
MVKQRNGVMMNRSVERRRFTVRGTAPGVLVVGWFEHPTRGRVRCSAAPLVAASLRRLGYQVREESGWIKAESSPADGVLFTASYLDRTGRPVGFGVAAHTTDQSGICAAREAVEAWSAVWRTRRVVVASASPFCTGARRARQMLQRDPRTQHRWIASLNDLTDVPDEITVALPAHGVPPVVRSTANARGMQVIDATCPIVAAAQAQLHRFTQRGDHVVVVGKPDHAAVPALIGQAPDRVVVVESTEDVAALELDPDQLSYLVQPGVVIDEAMRVVAALRVRYPRIRGTHPDGLCYQASDRAETVRLVSGSCDRMFILGVPGSADTAELVALVASSRTRLHVIDSLGQIRPSWLAGAECIGIAVGQSAPRSLHRTVVDVLSGLGPMSVVRRGVTTDIVSPESWLPSGTHDTPSVN